MGFVKLQKNKAYFKRYQVKYRRRREGKTNYHARRRMVVQDKTKYWAPKYRFVVRLTNKDVITQIITARIIGDKVVAAAYSHELPNYGVPVGLTNYAACYCTGLLLARRTLTKLNMNEKFPAVEEVTGEDNELFESEQGQRHFKAFLDVGLKRTTVGGRIFGTLKGALDGGLNVPHRPNKFPGFNKEDESLDAEKHRERIFGLHVANYMTELKESEPERYKTQFSRFIKNKIHAEGVENMYKKAHEQIIANPVHKKKERKGGKKHKHGSPVRGGKDAKKAAKKKDRMIKRAIKAGKKKAIPPHENDRLIAKKQKAKASSTPAPVTTKPTQSSTKPQPKPKK